MKYNDSVYLHILDYQYPDESQVFCKTKSFVDVVYAQDILNDKFSIRFYQNICSGCEQKFAQTLSQLIWHDLQQNVHREILK